jgi:hypothetical protein
MSNPIQNSKKIMTTKEKIISLLKEKQGTIELTTKELCEKLSCARTTCIKTLQSLMQNGTIFYASTKGRNGKLTITFQNSDTISNGTPYQGDTISNGTIYQGDTISNGTISNDTIYQGDTISNGTIYQGDTISNGTIYQGGNVENMVKLNADKGEVIDDDVVLNKILNYVEEVRLNIRKEYEDRIKSIEEEISQHLSHIKKICCVVHKLEAQIGYQQNVTPTIRFNYLKGVLEDPNKEWRDKKEASEELENLINSHTLTERQQSYAESILENYKKKYFKEELTERAKEFNKLRKYIGGLPKEELKIHKEEAEKLLNEREYFYNLAKKKRLPAGLIDPALLSLGVEAYEKAASLQNHELQRIKKTWLNEISKKDNASISINIKDAKAALYKIVKPINGTSEEKTEIIYKIVNAMEAHNKECQKVCVKVC